MNYANKFKYIRLFRYILFFISLIVFVVLIKNALNVAEQDKYILENKLEYNDEIEKEYFNRNYLINYLSGDYSRYFKSHEKGVTFPGEKIVQFVIPKEEEVPVKETIKEKIENNEILNISDPKISRNHFIYEKINFLEKVFK